MTKQMERLEEQVTRRFRELERDVKWLKSQGEAAKNAEASMLQTSPDEVQVIPRPAKDLALTKERGTQSVGELVNSTKSANQRHRNKIILDAATEAVREDTKVHSDYVHKRLMKDNSRLSDQIKLNEIAIEDSLDYVKTIAATNEAEAIEHMYQIEELRVSVNKKKQRRDTALAAVIAEKWRGKQEELDHLVRQVACADSPPLTSHELLTMVSSKLGQNGEVVQILHSKLKNRISCLHVDDTNKDTQFIEVQELSSGLAAALSERSALEDQERVVCLELMRSSHSIYKLVLAKRICGYHDTLQ
ncbi:unnamed protein product [Phytophthora lilii]|uniref:Unnamed protein product n=1 Tax=Phytophthora lilii TaxID=2077276 RepID=A0A9W6U4W5_9STRA|nr:unnamed protein product [Phytophthora lilii]